MKYSHLYSFALGLMMLCTSCAARTDANGVSQTRSGSVQQQIAELKEQKRIYLLRAEYFGREADRIFTQDWLAYKQYLAEQQRYQDLADQTDQEIRVLEGKRR